jgi:hypothetical protein
MIVVCFISSALAHIHVLVKMHDVLYFLHASSESPRSVVEKRGSQWMSSTLGKLSALRCWFSLEVCYEEAVSSAWYSTLLNLSALTWRVWRHRDAQMCVRERYLQ